ncbi:hypothetical protein GF314_09300, partial [bacterium]|nr:hypothetical protein [bacterium]
MVMATAVLVGSLLVLSVLTETAGAVSAADTVQTVGASLPTAGAYRIGEIAPESVALRSFLTAIEEDLAPGPPIAAAIDGVDTMVERVGRTRRSTDRYVAIELPDQIYEELIHRWNRLIAELDADRAILADHVSRLEDLTTRLTEHATRWEATRDRVAAEGLPDIADTIVDTNLDSIASTRLRLLERRDRVLAAQARLGELRAMGDEQRAWLDDWLEDEPRRAFTSWRAPLWKALDDPSAGQSVIDRVRLLAATYSDLIIGEREEMLPLVTGRLLLLVALVAVTLHLRRRIGVRADADPELQGARNVLQRPISTATLVFIVGLILVDPRASRMVNEALAIVVLLPLLRVIACVTTPALRGWIHLLAGLYLLWRLVGLAPADLLLHRLLMLGLSTVAVLAMLRFRRTLRRQAAESPADSGAGLIGLGEMRHHALRRAADVAVMLLLAAIVLNVIGLPGLALILTRGVLVSIQLAMLLRVVLLVLRSLATLLLHGRLASRSRILVRRGDAIGQSVDKVLATVAWVVWGVSALTLFGIWSTIYDMGVGLLFATLQIRDISVSLADILAFVAVVWLSFGLSRWLRALLEDEFLPRFRMPRGV